MSEGVERQLAERYTARVCGTCRYWQPYQQGASRQVEGFGTCRKAEMYDSYEVPKEVVEKWQLCVIDGSDYFAALKTRETFGCNQWELNDQPSIDAERG